MALYGALLIALCLCFLIAMNVVGKRNTFSKALVVVAFSILAFYITYRVLELFGQMNSLIWILLWLEFPVFLVEFWFIKEFAENLALRQAQGPLPRRQVYQKSTPKVSEWVKTGV